MTDHWSFREVRRFHIETQQHRVCSPVKRSDVLHTNRCRFAGKTRPLRRHVCLDVLIRSTRTNQRAAFLLSSESELHIIELFRLRAAGPVVRLLASLASLSVLLVGRVLSQDS